MSEPSIEKALRRLFINCLSKKVQRNKAILNAERYEVQLKAMSPEEGAERNRRGQEAMRIFAAAASVNAATQGMYFGIPQDAVFDKQDLLMHKTDKE